MASSRQKKAASPMSLKVRMMAWWQGYDPADVEKLLARKAALQQSNVPEDPPKPPASPAKPAPDVSPEDLELPFDPWDSNRVEIAQYIWGEGYCGPGGPEHVISVSKLLALSPEMSLLEIGANLGGPARTLADKFGAWVTGYETSERLVKLANEKSLMAGMAKKADIKHFSTEEIDSFGRNFDRAFAKEAFFTIENKARMMGLVEAHLKPSGLFLMTDFVLGSDNVLGKESYRQWRESEQEKRRPFMVTSAELVDLAKKARFNIRVSENITPTYIDLINKAWAGADKVAAQLSRQEDGDALLQALLKEAEFWSLRRRMMESGDLQVWRLLASKKSEKPSMMSNW